MISGKPNTNGPRHVELLTATGFMRMAPDSTQSSNSLTDRNQATVDAVQVIGSSTLGLTVGCAQCHDHKFDPIGIDYYYRFLAIFDPLFPLKKWQQPSARLVDVTSAENQKKAEEIEARAKEMDAAIQEKRTELAKTIQAAKLSDVSEEVREGTLQAVLAPSKDRNERQRELLDLYPMVKPVSFIAGFLVEYDNAAYREFEKQKAEVTKVRETKPPKRLVRVATEQPDVVPVSTVHFRGNPNSPGKKVQPGKLAVLSQAGGLADRLFTNHPIKADQRLDALFRKLFATAPTDEEKRYLPSLLGRQEELFRAYPNAEWQKIIKAQPDAPARRALAALAQVLMASNRFL